MTVSNPSNQMVLCNNDDVAVMTWLVARDLVEVFFQKENHPILSSGIFYAEDNKLFQIWFSISSKKRITKRQEMSSISRIIKFHAEIHSINRHWITPSSAYNEFGWKHSLKTNSFFLLTLSVGHCQFEWKSYPDIGNAVLKYGL